jgi:hypothetical protein
MVMAKIQKFRCDRCKKDEETTRSNKPEDWRTLLGPDKKRLRKVVRGADRILICKGCGALIDEEAKLIAERMDSIKGSLPAEVFFKNVDLVAKGILTGSPVHVEDDGVDEDEDFDEDDD